MISCSHEYDGEDTFGAYPGFTVTATAEKLVIPAGGSKRFELKFYASKD